MSTPADASAHVSLEGISLSFGRRQVMHDLSASFPRGEISVVMGGSGSGKSTMLRLIAGLTRPDAGSIQVGGEETTGLSEDGLSRVRQHIGMLFQNGALLDSMSIFANVALPLVERTKLGREEIAGKVHTRLEAVGLEDVDDLLPGELSGGMLKRAALARATINEPDILLADEPFSGLDPPNVLRIEALLTRLSKDLGLTVIMSSHHVASSVRMAARLVVLLEDAVVSGSPTELLEHEDSRVADFLEEELIHPEAPAHG